MARSGDRIFLRERTGHDFAPLPHRLRSISAMHGWVRENITPHFVGPAERLLGYEAAFALARRDGVSRLEFGDDVWQITQGLGSAADLLASLQNVHQDVAPEVEWIPLIGLSRHCAVSDLEQWITPFLELPAWRSLDLYGDESAQPVEQFRPIYRRAKATGLRLKAHVGEWGTADDVWRAVEELELDEVQHGIAAATSPVVMRFLAENGIGLNVAPTSNVMLGRVEHIEDHPIRQLYDAGVKVTLNSDDASVFDSTVSQEFISLFHAGVFTAQELEQIRQNGLTAD